jgi:hypothetical protein
MRILNGGGESDIRGASRQTLTAIASIENRKKSSIGLI